MSLRFLFAALPAILAPLGDEGEVRGVGSETVAEEWDHRSSWCATASSGLPAEQEWFGAGSEWDGPPFAASGLPVDLHSVLGAAHDTEPSGLASPWAFCRHHLAASGQRADRLDLPPPPRD